VICNSLLELAKFWLAVKALMFVLIRDMFLPQTKGLCLECGESLVWNDAWLV
jgi:hypothetical protein